jgi:hypothetical protein
MSIDLSTGSPPIADALRLTSPTPFDLTPAEQLLVEECLNKQRLIHDRVRSVVYKHATAVYIVGRSGTGKTYNVKEELDKHDRPAIVHNARLTAMGLFALIEEHPDHIIVLDDVPSIAKDAQALQILLAALDGRPGQIRTIRYRSKDKDLRVPFSGGMILTSNCPISHDPMSEALRGRVVTLEHDIDDAAMAAFMKHLTATPYADLDLKDRWEVCTYVIETSYKMDIRLRLRHFYRGLEDFRQFKSGNSEHDWKTLIRSNMTHCEPEVFRVCTKQEEIERQREIVRRLIERFPSDTKSQLSGFHAQTGRGKTVYYERHREVTMAGAAIGT